MEIWALRLVQGWLTTPTEGLSSLAAWLMGFVVSQRSGQLQQLPEEHRDLEQRLSEAGALLADAQRRSGCEIARRWPWRPTIQAG